MKKIILLTLLTTFAFSAHAATFHVKASASPSGDGLSWQTATATIEEALSLCVAGRGDEVWITAGTYSPPTAESHYSVPQSTSVIGGFDGDESSKDERENVRGKTTIDGNYLTTKLFSISDTTFDGLTVMRNGLGTAVEVLNSGSVSIENCIFTLNQHSLSYIGVIASAGNWTVRDSVFTNNTCLSTSTSTRYAAAVMVSDSNWVSINTIYMDNVTGLFRYSDIQLVNCLVANNSNGLYPYSYPTYDYRRNYTFYYSNTVAVNTVFHENTYMVNGIAGSSTHLYNCTVYRGDFYGQHDLNLFNSVISSAIIYNDVTLNTRYGGYLQTNNIINATPLPSTYSGPYISSAPQFANLSSPLGADNEWGTDDDGLRTDGTYTLDAGTPNVIPLDEFDLDNDSNTSERMPIDAIGYARSQGASIDLGAYELGGDQPGYELQITIIGGGTVNHPETERYTEGTIVDLVATPNPGYIFSSWSGDIVTVHTPSIQITMDTNYSLEAHFINDLSDDDNDGLSNYSEINIYKTNPDLADSNSDGISDGEAVNAGLDPNFDQTPVINIVKSDPLEFDLFDQSQLDEVGLGAVKLNVSGSNSVNVEFLIQESSDLNGWTTSRIVSESFDTTGDDNLFFRVKTE